MQNARLTSVMPVSVQPLGKPEADRAHLGPNGDTCRPPSRQYVCFEKPTPPLTGKDGSGRRVNGVGKSHGALRIPIRKARLFVDAWLVLPTLK